MKPSQQEDPTTTAAAAAPWYYSSVLLPLYVCWRVSMANRMPITDCDEVYNYWEPLHFVLYGSGLQTWEYAHEYALRSFAYILPLKWIAVWVWKPLLPYLYPMLPLLTDFPVGNEKVALFVLLRSTLGAVTSVTELFFLNALSPFMRRSAVRWAALVMLTLAGMNHSAAAYLPSSTWMMSWMLTSALFLNEQHRLFIVVASTTTLTTGWPFGVVMMVPMGCVVLWRDYQRKRLLSTIVFIILTTILVQGVTMLIDQAHYGIWLSPTFNIFTYNAAAGGDELYGTEPASFYVKNLLLNLNLVAPLGLLALPTCLFCRQQRAGNMTLVVLLSPLLLWLAITVPRPHKEERFMFPIYPLLVVGAVLTVDFAISDCLGGFMASFSRHKRLSIPQHFAMNTMVWLPIVLLSLSRTVALVKYYSAPLEVYAAMAQQDVSSYGSPSFVCTCGEWYRFPSSFYLPQGVQLGYLPSSFYGQLPQPFSKHGSRPESQSFLQPFNDQNLEQTERYVKDLDSCKWILDLEGSECGESLTRETIHLTPFLDVDHSFILHRILYIPYLHEEAVSKRQAVYRNYALYRVK